jgi:hypothetical protein
MTEQKFWGMAGFNEDEEFDYGRDIIREGSYDKMLRIPFKEMPLFTNGEWFQTYSNNELVQINGILRSGTLSGATLKADIKITQEQRSFEAEDSDPEDPEERKEQPDEELCSAFDEDMINELLSI